VLRFVGEAIGVHLREATASLALGDPASCLAFERRVDAPPRTDCHDLHG